MTETPAAQEVARDDGALQVTVRFRGGLLDGRTARLVPHPEGLPQLLYAALTNSGPVIFSESLSETARTAAAGGWRPYMRSHFDEASTAWLYVVFGPTSGTPRDT